ncbi:MAG: hypothetical protein ABSC50_00165 [Candidatus Bathyarchaeia archaeon]
MDTHDYASDSEAVTVQNTQAGVDSLMALVIWVLLASELVSAGLAIFIVYSMLTFFRATRNKYLLGFPIGFSFLALGYLVFGVSYAVPGFEELASWLHLSLVCYGFSFIAGTYFLKKRSLLKSVGRASVWLFSLLIILAVVVIATIVVPTKMVVPPYRNVDEMFRVTNLAMLAYIVFRLYQAIKGERHEVGGMVLSGFIFLAGNEYSLLLWALDSGFWSLALAHIMQLAGLVTLATALARGFRKG